MSHKGWNDPPRVSYDSFQQSTGKKSQLTKRPDYTIDQLPKLSAHQLKLRYRKFLIEHSSLKASSPTLLTEPPKSGVTPQLQCVSYDDTEVNEEQIKDIDALLESLNSTIARFEKHMQKKVLDDIHKRVDSFTAQWKIGKLSKPVKAAMSNLVDALATDDYAKADEIHIKLMVDHISEVSQWMIGIKKLILTIRTSSDP